MSMNVLLNSDVMFDQQLVRETLPRRLHEFCVLCLAVGNRILVPSTAVLEFERQQARLVEQARKQLEAAYEVLGRHAITFQRRDPKDLFVLPDLIALMQATGVDCTVVEPTIEDYDDAHRRACLHLPPHTDGKSDEMRDLVIWALALRMARSSGGAILVSADRIHHNPTVDAESQAAGLIRVRTFGQAREFFGSIRSETS